MAEILHQPALDTIVIPEYTGPLNDVVPRLGFKEIIDDRYMVLGRQLKAGNAYIIAGNRIDETNSSEVYKCRDLITGEAAAVKLLIEKDEAQQQRVTTEITVHTSLSGEPYIVPVLGAGKMQKNGEEYRYLATKYMPKGTLKGAEITEEELPEFLQVVHDYAAALELVHNKGIVHGDGKPRNILKKPGGGGLLADFGLATIVDKEHVQSDNNCLEHMAASPLDNTQEFQVTHSGPDGEVKEVVDILGTLAYISPEVLRDNECTFKADMYSFGATLYVATTNKTPWGINKNAIHVEDELEKTLSKMKYDVLANPRVYNLKIPAELAALTMACLDEPESRPTPAEAKNILGQLATRICATEPNLL